MLKSASTQAPPPTDGEIVDLDLSTEMRTSFLEYAYSVIYARACPTRATGSSRFSVASCSRWTAWVCVPTDRT